jgi:tRNA(Ile)-lysidine synthase
MSNAALIQAPWGGIIPPVNGLPQAVEAYIDRRRLLTPGERVVVAVSGGADSLALLDCLHSLQYPIVVAHFDHALRPSSWSEAEAVLRIAARLGVPAVAERKPVADLLEPGENLEAGARRLRYLFLADVAAEHGAAKVATGHTADDQVETVLMHLLRGTGTTGLRGMRDSSPLEHMLSGRRPGLRLVRPMLQSTRADTLSHCQASGLPYVEDTSNADVSFTRNRVRHELIPLLETYNPGVRAAISRAAEITARDDDALDEMAEEVASAAVQFGPEAVCFSVAGLRGLPSALVWRIVQRSLRSLTDIGSEVGFLAMQQVTELMLSPMGGHRELGGGVQVWKAGDTLVAARGDSGAWGLFPQASPGDGVPLEGMSKVKLSGWTLESGILGKQSTQAVPVAEAGMVAWLDAAVLPAAVTVRQIHPEDRLRPAGMSGEVRATELLARSGIPVPARSDWPVVVAGDTVLWVPGVRQADGAQISRRTRNVRYLRLQPPPWLARATWTVPTR